MRFEHSRLFFSSTELKVLPQFGTFKQAQRVQQAEAEQAELGLG